MINRNCFLLVTFGCLLAMASCNGGAVATPELGWASHCVRTNAAGVQDTVLITDTFSVGDTIRWNLVASGGRAGNTLVSFMAQSDSSEVMVSFLEDSLLTPYLAKGTDLPHAKMVFAPMQLFYCSVWMRCVMRKAGSPEIAMTIATDAEGDYSPRTWIYTPVIK